ncbi:WD domain, G-beta repeat protein (macronuclear) [Tetrahymena thermophila SB210]|uniref:WD domain, G-beta repeat protein n=1 Tax=Tetrahymena thermophila (strain SB210) TaxID=312017 RepID=Q23UK4_TETTS|nr:WD domain, G-beta repeat protein [Tetrahymena thermophila SB210]EAS00206.2 WD domain, G-beta repeat protein [Tetrahymena thermophila SB210]|eukprot:XP_001020451.2 WD domain, G-beta repeat protein [Tetrahymena thermophila SB210]
MRVCQVKLRTQNLNKMSKCILKQKKSTSVFKIKKNFKKIPFLKLQEEVISGHIPRHLQTYLPSCHGTNQTEKSQIRKQLRRLIQKQISPHIMDDIVESYQELLAHKYLQNGGSIQKRVLLNSLKDKIWQSYQEKLTSKQPSSQFQQELVEKSKISSQEKAKNEQNTQKQFQVSKCQASYLNENEKKLKAESISLPNCYSFQNDQKEYLREKIECQQQYIEILELVDQNSLKEQQDHENNCEFYSIIKEKLNVKKHQQKGKHLNNQTNKGNYQAKVTLTQIQRQNLINLIIKNQINKFNRKLIHIAENQLSFPQFRFKIEKQINNGRNKLLEEKAYQTFCQTQKQNLIQAYCFQMKTDSNEKRTSNQTSIQQQINKQAETEQNISYLNFDNNQFKVLQALKLQTDIQYLKFKDNSQLQCQELYKQAQKNKILGGGICGSKLKLKSVKPEESYQQIKKEIKIKSTTNQSQDDRIKEEQRINRKFERFNSKYNKYFVIKEYSDAQDSLNVLETDVREIIEKTLFKFREQIILQELRPKVIDIINLLINYLLIIKQNDSKSSVQSDINEISDKLQKLILYCKENKERHPCLDLFQYFDILKSLNAQRVGLDEANKHVATQIIEKIFEVAKFGAGFVSIAGAIKNLTEFDYNKLKGFINDIRIIVEKLTSDTVEGSINQGLGVYSDYNSSNISNNMLSLWLRKVQYMGENLSDQILEIIFYLEECDKIKNNDTRLFVYMQLNYLLSKQLIKDNFEGLRQKLEEQNKIKLIINQQKFLQLNEYSDGIIDQLKSLANFIAQSHQFRYIKAQLLLHFAQILSVQNQNEFKDMMNNIISNYLIEKQKSVKIVSEYNQIMAEFIDNQLDKTQILNQISQQKKQMTKLLDDKSDFDNFAYDIQNEKDLDKQLAKYFVQIWEQSVKQRQNNLEITHKDDVLLEAIHLYVNQQITFQDGHKFYTEEQDAQITLQDGNKFNTEEQDAQIAFQDGNKFNTEEQDAVKQIFDKFLIPNFVFSQEEANKNDQLNQKSTCKIISILAEGGSGKSMLLKKIEVEILSDNSKYKSDNRTDFIPFIIKCNSLDNEKPSIEDYLESLNIRRKDIDNLKKSERNKLIMLDGYDEYTGDYFKVYQKLNLNEWVNTLVIVTSRLEKITVSDAKFYFNYYDNQGNIGHSDSYAIFKLEKITKQDIEDYLEKYKNQKQQENQTDFDLGQLEKFQKIISNNNQLTELLKLPINLYLTTRMILDIDLNDERILNTFEQASDQIVIQELFFSQQFKKQAHIFVQQQKYLTLNDKQRQAIAEKVESCYFEYFQSIAMHMFIQKGQKSNFLSTTREQIKFQPRKEVSLFFKENKIDFDEIIQKLVNYVDSRVITRIQLKLEAKNTKNQHKENQTQIYNYKIEENQQQEFEFRHKSLFEYFAARAMKYDFDLHKENIFKLDISQLEQFNINKRIIMSIEQNASEQQILLKLYKLMKSDIKSQFFYQTYSLEDISKTNRYIQYLKKSKISKNTEKSKIDIGASNLLSALFLSNFLYPNLILKNCSFSLAYINSQLQKLAEFEECNLSDSLIENQDLEKYESSNMKNAILNGFQKIMDSKNSYQFYKVIIQKNHLVSINQSGFINKFEISENNFKLLLSKQITNIPLKNIYYESTKSIFVTHSRKSLFEINSITFDIISSFKFVSDISSLSINKSQYLVNLINNQIFQGDFQKGFTLLNQIQAESFISLKDIIITYKNKEINIYNQQNLQIIKNIKYFPHDIAVSSISNDEKYLAVKSQNKDCIIFNLQNQFDIIKTIQNKDDIISVAFSSDGKQLAILSEYYCTLWNVNEGFSFLQQQELKSLNRQSVTFSIDGRYVIACFYSGCIIYDTQQKLQKVIEIQVHTSYINQIAVSSNNQYIASCSDDTCNIWSIQNGLWQVNQIKGHNKNIYEVTFSGDSKYLATTSQYTCQIWNIEKDFLLHHTLEGNDNNISSVVFSADSKYLATVNSDCLCIIWDVDKRFQLLHSINAHDQKKINSIAFSFDGKQIATCSRDDNTFKVWNIQDGIKLIKTIQSQYISLVAFSPNGKYLATGKSGNINIWNVEKGYEFLDTIQAHSDNVGFIVFSANSKYLVSCPKVINENECKIWNVDKGFQLVKKIMIQSLPGVSTMQAAFSQDSKQLVIGNKICFIILNLEKGYESIQTEVKNIRKNPSFAFSSNFVINDSYFCESWSIERGFELINIIQTYRNDMQNPNFSSDGNYLVTTNWFQNDLRLWSVEKGFKLIDKIEVGQYIEKIAISPDSMFLATLIGQDIKIWNIQNQFQLITTIPLSLLSLKMDYVFLLFNLLLNEKYLAFSFMKICQIFDAKENFKLIHTIEIENENELEDNLTSVTISSDGKYLATSRGNCTCEIWSIKEKFNLVKMIKGNDMNSVIFSADCKYLAIYSSGSPYRKGLQNNFCEIRNAENEFSLITRLNFSFIITQVAFFSDNKYLAVNIEDETCKIYNLQKEFEIMNLNEFEDSEIKQTAASQLDSQLSNSLLDKLVKHNKIFQQIYEL